MRGLAYLLVTRGHYVVGADRDWANLSGSSDIVNIKIVSESQAVSILSGFEILIYSDAVPRDHELRELARSLEIVQIPFNEALGTLTAQFTTIAVTGAHGKSSTTAMLAHVLTEAGLDPTGLVGASLPAWQGRSARAGSSELMVVEADEYREHFLSLHPTHAIVTNIDFDHPDYYPNIDAVMAAYDAFLQLIPADGVVVTPQAVFQGNSTMAWPTLTETVPEEAATGIELAWPGAHMRSNAALALAMAVKLGVDNDEARQYLKTWPGIARRFESLGYFADMEIISDYGHHPDEIRCTIEGAREKYGGQRLLVIFEGHTKERMETFAQQFGDVLSRADGVILAPVFFPLGRANQSGIREDDNLLQPLVRILQEAGVQSWMMSSYSELESLLKGRQGKFNLAIGFSAGILDRHLRSLPLIPK